MKTVLATAFFVASFADVPVMPAEYTLLCEGSSATGFNWRNGRFVETSFKPSRHLVSNRSENLCPGLKGSGPLKALGEDIDWFFTRDVCLNIREFGTEYRPALSVKCSEYYVLRDGETWERSFRCDELFVNFSGQFDGLYRRFSDSTTGPNPKDDYRDSLLVEVGECSVIS